MSMSWMDLDLVALIEGSLVMLYNVHELDGFGFGGFD
jgi:hypothetical protein